MNLKQRLQLVYSIHFSIAKPTVQHFFNNSFKKLSIKKKGKEKKKNPKNTKL